jgi:DUF438 domain-containing protein
MTEMLNNREYRQKVLKELISELHKGKTVEEIKPRFEELIQGVSVKEISEMEQALIREGTAVEEIQKLCDVHAALFKGSIEEIHRQEDPGKKQGHPVQILKAENREIEELLKKTKTDAESFNKDDSEENRQTLLEDINRLWEIDKHYSRKENLIFPYMEKYGITAPPKVMWGVDDEIRTGIRTVKMLLSKNMPNKGEILEKVTETLSKIQEMIFKEENILIPMVLDTLTEDEWLKIAEESEEIGYTLIAPPQKWQPVQAGRREEDIPRKEQYPDNDVINFDAGMMTTEEVNAMLNTLPVDITFVDKDGLVKYFTQGKERIFARPKTIIGREVQNCHPPASVHVVETIVKDLQTGKKDHEDFWLKMGDKYVYIRYFAVRNREGKYLGIMEVSQDIQPIQNIKGEKRLLSE